jgi:hypothetical protein
MKEVINDHQYKNKDKKGLWRKATAVAGGLLLLTACDQQPQITDGTVYQKEYTKYDVAFFGSNIWAGRREIDTEVVSMPPTHKEIGMDKDRMSRLVHRRNEFWKVYIAQCPKAELPQHDKIEKECKTASFDVPLQIYNSSQLGQHADFNKTK